MDVLNRKPRIGLVEPNRGAVCSCRKVDELLEEFSAGRGRRVLVELEYEIEDLADVLGEVGDVLVEEAVIYGEETNLVVLQRHELCEVRCADLVQVFRRPTAPCAQKQLHLDEG